MGVDNPHRLQIGINDDRPHKFHAPALQVLGHGVRQFGADLACFIDRLPFRPVPEVAVEAPPLLLDGPEDFGVVYGGADFQFVPDNAGILSQRCQLFFSVPADRLQIKLIEGPAECLPLVEDALPGEPCLEALQSATHNTRSSRE